MPTPQLGVLLRGGAASLREWTERWDAGRGALCLGAIILGAGFYGAAMGAWRAPLQALYVAIKFPIIILLTTAGTGLLNAMLAPLLGLNLTLRQSLLAVLMSFAITSAVLGSFSPLIAFLLWNAPALSADLAVSATTHRLILLTHVTIIAGAGIAGNVRLLQLLQELSGSAAVGRRVLVAWLGGNLFLGSQLAWILRPFIGAPALPVQFLRPTAFEGNFYEAVFRSLVRLLNLN